MYRVALKEYWTVEYKEPTTGCWQHVAEILSVNLSGAEATAYAVYLTRLDNQPHMVVHYEQVGPNSFAQTEKSFMIYPKDVE